MANHLAIAAVTTALRNRITSAFGNDTDDQTVGTDVTTKPMDQAFTNPDNTLSSRLNLFLYHVAPSPAWRNRPAPYVKPGETSAPPLTLTLHYLISAQGTSADDLIAHRLLGKAMSCLHDEPLLSTAELEQLHHTTELAASDLHLQVERVRITEQPLTTEEMYKLWSAFQTHYRVSAAYEVSVVMIDTARPIKAPLPALGLAQPGGAPAPNAPVDFVAWPRLELNVYPTLTAVTPPGGRDYALIGDTLTISGSNLTGSGTPTALLSHPALPETVRQDVTINAQGAIQVAIPTDYPSGNPAFELPAGVYTLSLEILNSDHPIVTNAIPFLVAPALTFSATGVTRDLDGIPVVSVTVSPKVWAAQNVALLIGSQGFPPDTPRPDSPTATMSFTADVPPDTYYLRIRVDGVDSPIIDLTGPTPQFDVNAKVTIPEP